MTLLVRWVAMACFSDNCLCSVFWCLHGTRLLDICFSFSLITVLVTSSHTVSALLRVDKLLQYEAVCHNTKSTQIFVHNG